MSTNKKLNGAPELAAAPKRKLRFSILHTSARPDKWREIYEAWISACDIGTRVQYILVMDRRWGFTDEMFKAASESGDDFFFVCWNDERRCYVDGVNRAARESDMASEVLIVNADDQYPCPHWDTELGALIPQGCDPTKSPFVVRVNTGTPDEVRRNIVVMPIVSRAWYAARGHIFYPLYESMYADNDLAEDATKSGILVEAPHLLFPHRHPINGSADWDKPYESQNRSTAYELGAAVLARRRANGYTEIESDGRGDLIIPSKKTLAIGLPGDIFSSTWVASWTNLFGYLQTKFHVKPLMGYSSNVYMTRLCITDQIRLLDPYPDYVLWIDDDNLLAPLQFEQLLESLDALPDADLMAGWTWIQRDGSNEPDPIVSFGALEPSGICHPAPIYSVNYGRGIGKERPWVYGPVGYTGFPAVLMRGRALETERIGKNCFAPLVSDGHPWGFSGEDTAYCKRLGDIGGQVYVDLRVKVPHLKTQPAEPANLPEIIARAEEQNRIKAQAPDGNPDQHHAQTVDSNLPAAAIPIKAEGMNLNERSETTCL